MTLAHKLMDVATWTVSILWVIQFLAHAPKYRARNKRLGAPSIHCDRTGDFEARMHGTVFARRQGD